MAFFIVVMCTLSLNILVQASGGMKLSTPVRISMYVGLSRTVLVGY